MKSVEHSVELRGDATEVHPEAADTESSPSADLPWPSLPTLDLSALRRPQDEKSGVNAIWGTWDGDETDEELLAALEEIR